MSTNPFSQPSWAAALLDARLPMPAGLRTWNGSDPAPRFAVHRNNVLASLVNALADTFPVVQVLVGPEFFRALALGFVREHPPRSPVLAQYGDAFPAFVAQFEPAQSLPYLADVARLELARVQSCHAADAIPLSAADAAAALACGERIGALRLQLHPALRLVEARHAIVSLWAAHQGEGVLAQVDPFVPESALVVRPDLEVLVLRCDAGTAAFVDAVAHGNALAQAAAHAAACAGFDLSATLSLLMSHGALCALTLPEEIAP